MSGIAGIAREGRTSDVDRMLDRISHRGRAGRQILEVSGATLGAIWPAPQLDSLVAGESAVQDRDDNGRCARAQALDGTVTLLRDTVGVAPLYYGRLPDGALCFASEVKAMLAVTRDVAELPPGCEYNGGVTIRSQLRKHSPLEEDATSIAIELRRRLEVSVRNALKAEKAGAWLSGGLDSSAIAALARPHLRTLHTSAGGLPGSPDLKHAREVAEFIGSEHHEIVVNVDDLLGVLPQVIYQLESFDALLVRSSLMNYLVAKAAAQYAPEAFSGEGGDELFAGYEYLKALAPADLDDELIDITRRLHNTALQRVDRCAAAHGLLPHVAFLEPEVVDYALRIPVEFKLRDGVEKWILRKAMEGALPSQVLSRPKAKFWEGCGVGELLADRAAQWISDGDFARERHLRNGWKLNTKEEVMYYRIFQEHYGTLMDISWMGRTKGAPEENAHGRTVP